MKHLLMLSGIILSMTFSVAASSATEGRQVTITGVLTDDNSYGGCMAKLSSNPDTWGALNCPGPGGYVTLDCDGAFGSKSQAQTKLAAVQLALVTGKYVYVIADDTKKHNSYCLATRVDNLNTAP